MFPKDDNGTTIAGSLSGNSVLKALNKSTRQEHCDILLLRPKKRVLITSGRIKKNQSLCGNYMYHVWGRTYFWKHKTLSDVCWTVHHCDNWRIINQLDVTYYFIVLLIGSTCFGHYYVRHQELFCFSLQHGHYSSLSVPNLQHTVNQERNDQCGNQHYRRELLMMGIVVPETCWAYKKYNKIISGI